MKKRLLSALLILCMVFPALPAPAFAAGNGKAIQFGLGGIAGYDSTANAYQYLYFGQWGDTVGGTVTPAQKSPIKWRVLDTKTNEDTGRDGLFLLADQVIDTRFRFGTSDADYLWANSAARAWCNGTFFNGAFSAAEQAVVLAVTKSDREAKWGTDIPGTVSAFYRPYDNILNGDKVFFLSWLEIREEKYGFPSAISANNTRIAGPMSADGTFGTGYWLRSYSRDEEGVWVVGQISSYRGDEQSQAAGEIQGARPAMNLDPGKVWLVSAAVGGKSAAGMDGGLAAVADYAGSEWKLTLRDTSRDGFAAHPQVFDGKNLTVSYSGAVPKTESAPNEYISAVVKDNTGAVCYYGRLTQPESASGTLKIDLSGIDMSDKTIALFSEQYNGDCRTDYMGVTTTVNFAHNAYAVTNTLTHITTSNPADYRLISDTADYTATLTPDEGYVLPETITVKVNGSELPAADYTFAGGALTIPGEKINGDIEIIADAIAAVYSIEAAPASLDFGTAKFGYTAPAAQSVTITNTGNQPITVDLPTGRDYAVTAVSGFTGASASIAPNAAAVFSVQPREGLAVGAYQETLTISGSNGVSAEAALAFAVERAPQAAPAAPELERRTTTSITLKTIPANENGAQPEYSRDGQTWQDSPEFTGLESGKVYTFVARYKETVGYLASPASAGTDLNPEILRPDYFALIFETNGGSAISPVYGPYGTQVDLAGYVPVRSGYTVLGWYSDAALTSRASSVVLTGSVTVYAAWQTRQAAGSGFADVPAGSYYEEAVNWAAGSGIAAGVGGGLFDPEGLCTRAQAVSFLWRASGSPMPQGAVSMPFTDVAEGSYYYYAVAWAAEHGIAAGVGGTLFDPDGLCSRGQIVTFLWRMMKSPAAEGGAAFADVAESDYYAGAVAWALREGVTTGTTPTTFSPADLCTRAQIVTFLWRALV